MLESSNSENIRKTFCFFFWEKIRNFFRIYFFFFCFFVFSSLENVWKYEENVFWGKYKVFLSLGLESSISQNIRKNFFWKNIKIFSEWIFLIFLFFIFFFSLSWKLIQVVLQSTAFVLLVIKKKKKKIGTVTKSVKTLCLWL